MDREHPWRMGAAWLVILALIAAIGLIGTTSGCAAPQYVVTSCTLAEGERSIRCMDLHEQASDEPTRLWSQMPPCDEWLFTSVPARDLAQAARDAPDGVADASCAYIRHPRTLGITIGGYYLGF